MNIHPLAIVSPQAKLGEGTTVGPFSIVEPGAVVGKRCTLAARVVVKEGTTLGDDNLIHEGAVLGGCPQHVNVPPHPGGVDIGSNNTFRENVTVHRALQEGAATRIGSHNLLMVGAHVAHDCTVGDHVILANNVLLGGFVDVADRAFLSGAVAVHQFCRIGALSMLGGCARIVQDVPPYVMVDGHSGMIVGLNLVGLRRNGFGSDDVGQLKAAYRVIYRRGLRWVEVLEVLRREFAQGPAAAFHPFFSAGTRGFIQERRTPPGATLKLRRAAETDRTSHTYTAKAG